MFGRYDTSSRKNQALKRFSSQRAPAPHARRSARVCAVWGVPTTPHLRIEHWGLCGEEGEPPAGVIEGDFVAVSAGVYHALALRSDGRAVAFGSYDVNGDEPAEGRAGPFRQVCAGWKHDVGLRLDNTVEAWGDNDRGQTEAPEGTFVAICAGDSHSLALGPDGVVQGWGWNDYGQSANRSGAKRFALPPN